MPNTVIALKKSATPDAVPTNLANGELALNYADGKLYYKNANGTITFIASGSGAVGDSFGVVNVNGTLLISDTPSDVLNLVSGNNITLSANTFTDTIIINADVSGAAQDDFARNQANAAYVQANTARIHANAAFDQANAAFSRANLLAVNVGSTVPVSNTNGKLWWNSDNGYLYIYYTDVDSSQWVQIGNGSGGGGGGGSASLSRDTKYFDTSSLSQNQSENINVSISKTFSLLKLLSTKNSWIRLYSDFESRNLDSSRSIGVDPIAGSGLLAEFITTSNTVQKVTPFVVCGNLDEPPTSNIYVRVTNLSSETGTINISMTIVPMET
jgi:hypothetical protein